MKSLLGLGDPDVQVWPSYTDVALNVILILLLTLFTLIIIVGHSTAVVEEQRRLSEEQQKRIEEMLDRQMQLRQIVEQAISKSLRQAVTITEDGNLQRYSFADQVLFDSGRAELKESGMEILAAIGQVFTQHVGAFSNIQIDGHTDDRPINTSQFPSNWELSSARATSVVRFLQDRVGLDPALLSATGYSEYHPVDTNDTDAGKARNRRIEVVIVYSLHQEETGTASTQEESSSIQIEEASSPKEGSGDEDITQTTNGYRIQVYSTQNKAAADQLAWRVISWWKSQPKDATLLENYPSAPADLPVYIISQQSNHRIRIGDFVSKDDAMRLLPVVQNRFPDAFITPDTITKR